MKQLLLIFIFFLFGLSLLAQVNPRIATLENKLELLNVEIPALTKKVEVNISNTTLANLLLSVSKVHGINMNVAQELNAINVVTNFSDITVENLLIFLAKEYYLDIDFTGNVLSFSKYTPPAETPIEKSIQVSYDPTTDQLSMDLQNDPLDKVFRKIMDESGKNLLYSPQLQSQPLSLYINNVDTETALQKLAESNNLEFNTTTDGFFTFEAGESLDNQNSQASRRRKSIFGNKKNQNYTIVDTLRRRLNVDFVNTPISEIVYSIGNDLGIDIFIATSLEEAGSITMTADNITFDRLLEEAFKGSQTTQNVTPVDQNQGNRNNASFSSTSNFTFKREGNIYFFGKENQLTLKKTELIQLMYRSIELLSDPNMGYGSQRRAGRSNFATGATSFIGGTNFNGNQQSQRRDFTNQNNTSQGNSSSTSIEEIIPDELKEGLDIKVDTELNSFVVNGPAEKVERFKRFLTYIDKPVPVILIEVMILEVNRTATLETGVSFGLADEPSTTEGVAFPDANMRLGANTVNRIIGGFSGFGSLNLGRVTPNFYLDIKAMESNGNIKILSTPKLSTLNGHKAHLSSGQTTYYAIVNQNFLGTQNPITSEITNYVPIDAELAIDIKPFVSGNGQITLDIQVIQSSFNGERIAEDAPPGINSREFSSIIRMKDNDVAILGGIEEKIKDDSGTGVPLLARVPVIKWLFSKRRRQDTKRKLNILLKPTVFY